MQGIILTSFAVLMWAFGIGVVAKSFTAPALMWYPVAALLASIVIVIALTIQGRVRSLVPKNKKVFWLLMAAGVSMTLNNAAFMSGVQITSVAIAVLTHYLMPTFVILYFAPKLLREKPSKTDIALALTGFLGLVIILWPDLSVSKLNLGAMLGALSAVFFALGVVIARKLGTFGQDGQVAAFYQNFVPALLMAVPALLIWQSGTSFTTSDLLGIAYYGILALGAGFILFFKKASHWLSILRTLPLSPMASQLAA